MKPSRYSKPLTKEYFFANLNFSLDFDENCSCLPVPRLSFVSGFQEVLKEALFNCKQQLKLIFAVPVNYPASDWSDLSPLERLVSHSGKFILKFLKANLLNSIVQESCKPYLTCLERFNRCLMHCKELLESLQEVSQHFSLSIPLLTFAYSDVVKLLLSSLLIKAVSSPLFPGSKTIKVSFDLK